MQIVLSRVRTTAGSHLRSVFGVVPVGKDIADEYMGACSRLSVMPKPPSTLLRRSLRTRPLHDLAHKDAHSSVKITTLTNRIRVATEATPGHFASVGLYIDAGSRYETPSTSGVSHFLDRMAFKV